MPAGTLRLGFETRKGTDVRGGRPSQVEPINIPPPPPDGEGTQREIQIFFPDRVPQKSDDPILSDCSVKPADST